MGEGEIVDIDGLVRHLVQCYNQWKAAIPEDLEIRGKDPHYGGLDPTTTRGLYKALREVQPSFVLETGVLNGFSTATILLALHHNDKGRLLSIDYPEKVGDSPSLFWEGKGAGVLPEGYRPGWVVPEELRYRWDMVLGRVQDILPALTIPPIGIMFCDSEHSYENVLFELNWGWPRLGYGGGIIVDDGDLPEVREAVEEFCKDGKGYFYSNRLAVVYREEE